MNPGFLCLAVLQEANALLEIWNCPDVPGGNAVVFWRDEVAMTESPTVPWGGLPNRENRLIVESKRLPFSGLRFFPNCELFEG